MCVQSEAGEILKSLFLIFSGLFTGFIDSIAGGGGLISLPVLSMILGPGADAIGTNKIVGTSAALIALIVYARAGHMDVKKSAIFTICIALGSFTGSLITPHLPRESFRWIFLLLCPFILWVVLKKDFWTQERHLHPLKNQSPLKIGMIGILCGIYDGGFGPGGGTFMFLSLLWFARLPLFTALAASKLANTTSAGVALLSYASGGFVHWVEGVLMAIGVSLGAFIGARFATRKASKIVRPILITVCLLLMIRFLF